MEQVTHREHTRRHRTKLKGLSGRPVHYIYAPLKYTWRGIRFESDNFVVTCYSVLRLCFLRPVSIIRVPYISQSLHVGRATPPPAVQQPSDQDVHLIRKVMGSSQSIDILSGGNIYRHTMHICAPVRQYNPPTKLLKPFWFNCVG